MTELTLGKRIAERRKLLGLSQEALGEKLGVSRQAISKWESDGTVPELDKLIALSKLFGISVGWLLGTEEEKTDEGFSEEQLKLLEQMIGRYSPGEQREKKAYRWHWLLGSCAVLSLMIMSVVLVGINAEVQQHTHQITGVQSGYTHIRNALGLLSERLNELAEGEKLLADSSFAAVAWADRAGADIVFTATPRKWGTNDKAYVSVRHSGLESERFSCNWDGTACTAQLSLRALNGYEFCYVVEHDDGTAEQQMLSNTGMEDLAAALQLRCDISVGEISADGRQLVLNGVNFNVAAPRIGKKQEILMLEKLDWVLEVNGTESSRTALLLEKELEDINNISGNISGLTKLPLPAVKNGDCVELYLCAELSDGTQTLTYVHGYELVDGRWVAVG